jgi:pimeloyl-ACP methyl ester carboxylesterase
MHVELVRTVTTDGLRLDGALALGRGAKPQAPSLPPQRPGGQLPAPTAAILLHGVAGNFYTSSTFEPLVPRLQSLGLDVLCVNTRGHDSVFGASLGNVRRRMGAAYETVDDCRHDLAAWVGFLKDRGHVSLLLIGHSLGAIKAVYATAHERLAEVSGVIAVSPPRLSYSAFMNAPESSVFFESIATAQQMVQEGRGDELFTGKFPFPLLITASGYIDKYGPAERYNILRFADKVSCPAVYLYGGKELTHGGIAFAGMPEALGALPHAEHRDVAIVEGADHFYAGLAEQLTDQIEQWLVARYVATP